MYFVNLSPLMPAKMRETINRAAGKIISTQPGFLPEGEASKLQRTVGGGPGEARSGTGLLCNVKGPNTLTSMPKESEGDMLESVSEPKKAMQLENIVTNRKSSSLRQGVNTTVSPRRSPKICISSCLTHDRAICLSSSTLMPQWPKGIQTY